MDSDDPARGIFLGIDYAPGRPPERRFSPWHRPRKHFVRREQWTAQSLRLFEGRENSSTFRYLGLPGVDLLDLRYLHQRVCAPFGRELRFLGFTTEAQPGNPSHIELNTSLDEVRRLPNVDPKSEVLVDDFRSLAITDSIAWRTSLQLGPFDVVNLDLCDGLASDDPTRSPSLYAAIGRLMALQTRSLTPWLLLVTTRIGRPHFHPEAQAALLSRYHDNIASCPEFAAACREVFRLTDLARLDFDTCDERTFCLFSLVILCKWLLNLAQDQSPNRLELASCQGYRVDSAAACADMASLAIRVEPVIATPQEPLRPGSSVHLDECANSARLARRVLSLKDVDKLVAGNAKLLEALIVETEDLLRLARYDVARYRPWLTSPLILPG